MTPNPYHPLAVLIGEPTIGEGTWIGPFCLIDGSGGLEIGRHCDIASGAHIYTHSTVKRCVTGRVVPIERKPVRIGDRTFIGANAVIQMGLTIGSHCIVGAGAVVSIDLPDCTAAFGVPAKIVGTVDSSTGEISYR